MNRKTKPWMLIVFCWMQTFISCFSPPEPVEPVIQIKEVPKEVIKEVQVPVKVETPPETLTPLTKALLERLQKNTGRSMPEIVKNFQLYVNGRLTLEREHVDPNDALNSGKAQIQNIYTKDVVTIKDKTLGVGINLEGDPSMELIITVKFEDSDPAKTIEFSNDNSGGMDGFFIKYNKLESAGDDVKGEIKYGDEKYRLKYAGDDRPNLLVKLDQSDKDKINERTVSGVKLK